MSADSYGAIRLKLKEAGLLGACTVIENASKKVRYEPSQNTAEEFERFYKKLDERRRGIVQQVEHSKSCQQRRYARKKLNGGSHTEEEWLALCNSYGNRCLCCGSVEKLTRDHVTPISRGGSDSIDNIQPLCLRCNSKKSTNNDDYRMLFKVNKK